MLLISIVLLLTLLGNEPEPWTATLQQAASLSRSGNYQQALEKYAALLSASSIQSAPQLHAYTLSQMADIDIELGSYAEAEARTREALGILANAHKTETSTFAIAEGIFADALRAEGNYSEARRTAEQALSLGKATLGPFAPRVGILETTLGRIFQENGELNRALPLCREAVQIFEKGGEANRTELGSAYQNLAVVYAAQRKPRKALDAIGLALAIWQPALPPHHPFIIYALCTRLVAYGDLKAFREAEELIPQAIHLSEHQFGISRSQRVMVLSAAASVYVSEKKYDEAEPFLREAVDVGKQQYPPGHPLIRNALLNYSYVLEKLNRRQEAARHRAEAEVLLAFPQKPGLVNAR